MPGLLGYLDLSTPSDCAAVAPFKEEDVPTPQSHHRFFHVKTSPRTSPDTASPRECTKSYEKQGTRVGSEQEQDDPGRPTARFSIFTPYLKPVTHNKHHAS